MPSSALPIAYPLDDFYAQAGRGLPPIEGVEGDAVPEPYKSLLVHQDDMTPTLEKFHGERIHLAVLSRQQRDDFYFREVVLLLDKSDKPVEFGVIKINLALFPPAPRKKILEERRPLGTLLADYTITHTSRPKAFLKILSDDFINASLQLSQSQWLYGRRNTLWDPQQRPLAEIVEILPPA
jgi:chorismate-pyruvate lyase